MSADEEEQTPITPSFTPLAAYKYMQHVIDLGLQLSHHGLLESSSNVQNILQEIRLQHASIKLVHDFFQSRQWCDKLYMFISFISNVILFLFYFHTCIVKLHKSVTCWMCMCMHGMNWMKSEKSEQNYHFKIWCLHIILTHLWRRGTCHVGILWHGYRGVPSSQVLLYFHPILTCVFHASIKQFFSILYSSTLFLIGGQPDIRILLLHINLCLLVPN